MNLKNFFESRATTFTAQPTKPTQLRFILRRERDRTRFILFYCAIGFFLIFGQSAFAQESTDVCVTSFAEMKLSPSDKLRTIANQMDSTAGFTNNSKSSHIKFKSPDGPKGRILVSFYSTASSDGSLEFEEGALTVCDRDGNISISAAPTGKLDVSFTPDCFKIGGLVASLQPARFTFCAGDMPVQVKLAMEAKQAKDRGLAGNGTQSLPTSDSLPGSGAAAKGVIR